MSRFLQRIKLVLEKHARSEGLKPNTKLGTVEVRRLKTGYYEIINKGLLQGFIEKKYKRWNLSLYGVPTKTYSSFKKAKEEAIQGLS